MSYRVADYYYLFIYFFLCLSSSFSFHTYTFYFIYLFICIVSSIYGILYVYIIPYNIIQYNIITYNLKLKLHEKCPENLLNHPHEVRGEESLDQDIKMTMS